MYDAGQLKDDIDAAAKELADEEAIDFYQDIAGHCEDAAVALQEELDSE